MPGQQDKSAGQASRETSTKLRSLQGPCHCPTENGDMRSKGHAFASRARQRLLELCGYVAFDLLQSNATSQQPIQAPESTTLLAHSSQAQQVQLSACDRHEQRMSVYSACRKPADGAVQVIDTIDAGKVSRRHHLQQQTYIICKLITA